MATPASEPINGMAVEAFDERIAAAREGYLNAISDSLDEALAKFLLPSDRIAVLHDAAAFVCFMVALKAAEVTTGLGQTIDAKSALRMWWPIEKKIKAEVGPMLLEWGKEAVARQVKGTGDAAE